MIVFGLKKATRSGNQFRCALIFHYHACLHTHTYMQAAHTGWLLADMIGILAVSEIASVGLMNSGQNRFRQSQQRINTIAVINGNKIIFTPENIIALSRLLCPVPLLSSSFPLPSVVCTPPSLTSFSFLCNLFILYFLSAQFKSNTSFKRESFSGIFFFSSRQRCASCLSTLCSRYCLCCNSVGMFHTERARNKVPK